MSERTGYAAQFESSPRRESHFSASNFVSTDYSPSVKWPYCFYSTVLYDFKAVAGLFHSKPDCIGRARTSPELWFHEDFRPNYCYM